MEIVFISNYIYSNEAITKPPTILEPQGKLPYKSDWDAHRKIKIKPLRETNVGVAHTKTDITVFSFCKFLYSKP